MPDDLDAPEDQPQDSGVIRDLRKKAERADAAEAEADGLRRQLALAKSGLTLNEKQTAALAATHEGEWTTEALTATAESLGWASQPAAPATPEPTASPVTQAELDAMRRTAAAGTGEPSPPTPGIPEQIMQATTREEVLRLAAQDGLGLLGSDA